MTTLVDALIVGAGPTGLTLGLCLLRQGKSVAIVDKHLNGLDFSRAILINSDTLEALGPLGVSEPLRAAGIAVDGFTLHVNGRPISQARYAVSKNDTSHPVCLPQLKTEAILTEHFLGAGGELIRGYEFSPAESPILGESPNDSILTVLHPYQHDADVIEVQSEWLFGCDGFHSAVRSSLGIAFPGSSLVAKPHAVDLDLAHWPFETNTNVFLDASGGCLAVQIGPNQLRLVTTTLEQRESFLKSLPVTKVSWDSTFDVHFHVADEYGKGHVWLAGDAVHVHSPVGGRGMNMGILDAVSLAAAVQSGNLDQYASERHAAAKQWVEFNRRISTVALDSSVSSQRLRKLLTAVLPFMGKLMGRRLANTAFSRLSSSKLLIS